MVFWLIGANAPIMNNAFKFLLKCQEIMEKIIGVYLDMLCLHTRFCEKRTIFMGCAKKTKQHPVKVTKNVIFSRNFVIFFHIFFEISKYVF
jgi:hypothetical protein